jgi:hypothetical protein
MAIQQFHQRNCIGVQRAEGPVAAHSLTMAAPGEGLSLGPD